MKKIYKILSFVFIVIGIICLVISFSLLLFSPTYFNIGESFDIEIANKFGGFIAGVTGIFFAGTGTFLVFLTFEQQREQFKISQFENSFFNLLSHLQTIIEHISGPVSWANIRDGNVSGRKYFYYQIRELKELIKKETTVAFADPKSKYNPIAIQLSMKDGIKTNVPFDFVLYKEFIENIYEIFYRERYSYLGHYFRFIYNILKYVDESKLNKSEKEKYINIFQSQMTSDELGLLLYNGLGKYGKEKLFPLLEEYRFLSNIDKRVIENANYITKLYPTTNFKFFIFE